MNRGRAEWDKWDIGDEFKAIRIWNIETAIETETEIVNRNEIDEYFQTVDVSIDNGFEFNYCLETNCVVGSFSPSKMNPLLRQMSRYLASNLINDHN